MALKKSRKRNNAIGSQRTTNYEPRFQALVRFVKSKRKTSDPVLNKVLAELRKDIQHKHMTSGDAAKILRFYFHKQASKRKGEPKASLL